MDESYKDIHSELIESCRRGDSKAQYSLYKLYSKSMYSICYRMTNNTLEAEDILQEAFVSAFTKIDTFKGESSFGAWLKKIVINKALNEIKKNKIEWENIEKAENEYDEVEEDDLIYNIDIVKEAIMQLPKGYRVIFSLYLMEGYDHSEISSILGISESTSKSQYNRSKKKLREILKKEVYYEKG